MTPQRLSLHRRRWRLRYTTVVLIVAVTFVTAALTTANRIADAGTEQVPASATGHDPGPPVPVATTPVTPATTPARTPATTVPGTPRPDPTGSTGNGYVLADPPVTGVRPSTARPPNKAHREFQANCAVSHRRADDPIVFPNLPGASHDHTFMGNTTTNAASTTGSLQAGGTLCRVPGDRSGYWMPTLYNGDTAVLPTGPQTIYYKSGVRDYTSVRPFPAGLRFLVGNPKTTADQFAAAPGYVQGWECGGSYRNIDFPATCPANSRLNLRMQAPSCWDGLHLDSPDHTGHVAYPVDGVCPARHPVAVPMIEFKMAWPVSGDLSRARLASGRGFTFHYDFYNAWDAPTLAALVKHCVNAGRQCDARGYSQFEPAAGAALDENYMLPGAHTALSRTGWTATASAGGEPAKMIDGDSASRWTTGTRMAAGQSFTVDMHAVHPLRRLSMSSPGLDYAQGYQVLLSTDGRTWTDPVASGPGTTSPLVIAFSERRARYVKVVQTGSADNWWSVSDFKAYSD